MLHDGAQAVGREPLDAHHGACRNRLDRRSHRRLDPDPRPVNHAAALRCGERVRPEADDDVAIHRPVELADVTGGERTNDGRVDGLRPGCPVGICRLLALAQRCQQRVQLRFVLLDGSQSLFGLARSALQLGQLRLSIDGELIVLGQFRLTLHDFLVQLRTHAEQLVALTLHIASQLGNVLHQHPIGARREVQILIARE